MFPDDRLIFDGTINDSRMRLYNAITNERSDLSIVRRLIQQGIDLNYFYRGGLPLHHAARAGNLAATELLLAHKVSVRSRELNNKTPLHLAAACYKPDGYGVCKLLLENGANTNDLDHRGTTPFHVAVQYGGLGLVKLFLRYGADLSVVNECGETALHHAVLSRDLGVIEFIIAQGVDTERRTKEGMLPLYYAAARVGHAKMCEILLKHEATVNGRNDLGNVTTALFLAVEHNLPSSPQVVQVLLEYGARMTDEIWRVASGVRHGNVRNAIVQHMVKLKFLNCNITYDDQRLIANTDNYEDYYQISDVTESLTK